MNDEDIKKIIEDNYDESKEDTVRSWIRDAFSKRMRWVMINVNAGFLILSAVGIFCAIKFFRADQTGYQIMYAVIFVCCSHWIGFMCVLGWVMMQRPSISRETKRLELRIAELTEIVKKK